MLKRRDRDSELMYEQLLPNCYVPPSPPPPPPLPPPPPPPPEPADV